MTERFSLYREGDDWDVMTTRAGTLSIDDRRSPLCFTIAGSLRTQVFLALIDDCESAFAVDERCRQWLEDPAFVDTCVPEARLSPPTQRSP